MPRIQWPTIIAPAVSILTLDHPNAVRIADQVIDHARAGRVALALGRLAEAKYHRDCCRHLLWRLGVDGLMDDGQMRMDGAKYETRLPGRHSSAAARAIRESSGLARRAASSLENLLAPDHIVPRTCVSEALISPEWVDLEDAPSARAFVAQLAEVAILSPEEDARLTAAGWKSDMPEEWWKASAAGKLELRFERYRQVGIEVQPFIPVVTLGAPRPKRLAAPLVPAGAHGCGGNREAWRDPRRSLEILNELIERHGLTNELFRHLHHGHASNLKAHLDYCKETGRFVTDTNPETGMRLADCLHELQRGSNWVEAIERALSLHPVG